MKSTVSQLGSSQQLQQEILKQAWAIEQLQRDPQDKDTAAPTIVLFEFAVQSIHDDYLVCKHYDGSAAFGDDVNVAKDPELRHTHYDGLTIDGLEYEYTGAQARTVTKEGTSDSKDQIVIPKYHVPADGEGSFPGSIITALPTLTRMRNDDDDDDVFCQYREVTQRAFANEEAA